MINKPFLENIEQLTLANENFRKVIYTADHCQVVLMTLQVNEEIGKEVHQSVDQFFRFESGEGRAIVAEKEYKIQDGTALVVPAGLEHNIINIGPKPLKFYTIYAPAHHIDGRIHITKQDALDDVEDEKYGK